MHRLVVYNLTKEAELSLMDGEEVIFEMDSGEVGDANLTNATYNGSIAEYLCIESTKCYTANTNGLDWELHKILLPDSGSILVAASGGGDYKSCQFGGCVTSCYGKMICIECFCFH